MVATASTQGSRHAARAAHHLKKGECGVLSDPPAEQQGTNYHRHQRATKRARFIRRWVAGTSRSVGLREVLVTFKLLNYVWADQCSVNFMGRQARNSQQTPIPFW